MTQQNQDLADVLRRLQSFEQKMDAAIAQAQSRKNTSLVMMIIVVVAMASYLTFAHKKIKEVDASTVVYLAEAKVTEYMDQSAPQLTASLQAQAPHVIGLAEQRLLDLPEALTSQVRTFLSQQIAAQVPDLEATLSKTLSDSIKEAHARHSTDGKPIDDEQLKTIFNDMAAAYGKQLRDMVTKLHSDYRTNSTDLLDYMRHLADSEDAALDGREKLHRGLVVSVLAMLEQHAPSIDKLPGQNPD